MNIGEKVRYIRKSNELNQNEFALRVGVSQGTLSDLERGVCLPSCETLVAIMNKFNCDLNWLLGEGQTSPQLQLRDGLTKVEAKLLQNFRNLPSAERNEVIEIINLKLKKNKYPERIIPSKPAKNFEVKVATIVVITASIDHPGK